MKIFLQNKFLISIIICLMSGCFASCTKIKTPEAQLEHEKWIEGFSDSIDYYKKRSDEITSNLNEITSRINETLQHFDYVNNPREVTGYYLLSGWKNKLPFTSTAIYARVNENEKLELIAILAGSTFNRIGVGVNGSEVYSEVVPHDQAFNYRHERYNTVCFSGGKADTIAQYIADHRNDRINLEFIENSGKKNFIIPEDEKKMISQTWNLFQEQNEAKLLQKELWICSRKIDTFRRFKEQQFNKEKTENNN